MANAENRRLEKDTSNKTKKNQKFLRQSGQTTDVGRSRLFTDKKNREKQKAYRRIQGGKKRVMNRRLPTGGSVQRKEKNRLVGRHSVGKGRGKDVFLRN